MQVRQGIVLAVLVVLAAGCASEAARPQTIDVHLAGWRSAGDAPGISQLAPDLSGLDVTGSRDARALVRNGDAIRASRFTFRSGKQAAEAKRRTAGDDYASAMEHAFRGNASVETGPGLRLTVPRPTGKGLDTVELYALARGRTVTLIELESAHGFDPKLRARVLRLFSR